MGTFSIWHMVILLAVVLAVFGTKKFANAGKDLGSAVKGFKDAMSGSDSKLESDAHKLQAEQQKQSDKV